MKKTLTKFTGILVVTMGFNANAETSYEYADVLASTPIYRVIEIEEPREQCWEEEIVVEQRAGRQGGSTPVLVSTILGGAIGNAVGSNKSSQRVGAVVGAVLGHSIGRDIVRSRGGRNQQYVETVERCNTVYDQVQEERLVGYKVTYLYEGEERTVRADSDPGEQIRIRVSFEPVL